MGQSLTETQRTELWMRRSKMKKFLKCFCFCCSNRTVGDLKEKIKIVTKIDVEDQKLTHNDRELENTKMICEDGNYFIQCYDKVFLTLTNPKKYKKTCVIM